MSLPSHDQRHLLAAQGWLELGTYLEADAELDNITPTLRGHPDVLAMRWQIYSLAGKWDACLDIATAITQLAPDSPLGWLHRAYTLHVLKRTAEARATLLAVIHNFPEDATMHHNLACYECQLGDLTQARRWLSASFAIDNSKEAKLQALSDPDLEPLWQQIGEL